MLNLPFKKQLVRDLAWVMVSPPLLSDEKGVYRYPVVSEAWSRRNYECSLAWLAEQEENTHALTQWMGRRKSHLLGLYFEDLVEYWLRNLPGYRVIDTHVHVADGGRTISEFDFIFEDPNQRVYHWEVAAKFYLRYRDKQHRCWWLGPNSRDQFRLKVTKIFDGQLSLADHGASQALLKKHGIRDMRRAALVKGYLFYPLNDVPCERFDAPLHLSDTHLRGWWIRHKIDSVPTSGAGHRWQILPRLRWLAPSFCADSEHQLLMTYSQIQDKIDSHFLQSRKPLLLAELHKTDHSDWVEGARGFVVPSQWPGNFLKSATSRNEE